MTASAGRPSLAAFLHARLSEWVVAAERVEPDQAPNELRVMVLRSGGQPFLIIDSALVLHMVEAIRAIVDAAQEATGLDMQVDQEFRTTYRNTAAEPYLGDVILRHFVSIWRHHPDYDPEWRP